MKRTLTHILLVLLFVVSSAHAGTPEETFNTLFGDDLKQVHSNQNTLAAADFAKKLLDSAAAVSDDKPLQSLMYTKACEFGSLNPAGYATAIQALELLETADPDLKQKYDDKILLLAEKQYNIATREQRKEAAGAYVNRLVDVADARTAAGNIDNALMLYRKAIPVAAVAGTDRGPEIIGKLSAATTHQAAANKCNILKARLQKSPTDAKAAADLATLLLLEFNQTQEAAKLSSLIADPVLARIVQTAAKDPAELTEEQALELGGWYKGQSSKVGALSKPAVLEKAKTYYGRVLELHATQDVQRLKVTMALQEVDKLTSQANQTASNGNAITKDRIINSIGTVLVRIRPGRFIMGMPANEERRRNNETQHQVTISKAYFMGNAPVTVGQFKLFVNATGYKMGSGIGTWKDGQYIWDPNKSWLTPGFAQTDDHPVVCVNWYDALMFCHWLGKKEGRIYRLPTEAEYEYACRAGTTTAYYTGDNVAALQKAGWYRDNSGNLTHPVGQKAANAWGLYDMLGNVHVWCHDQIDAYPTNAVTDPAGPIIAGRNRVIRGGSWVDFAATCRSGARMGVSPVQLLVNVGFRLVMDDQPPKTTPDAIQAANGIIQLDAAQAELVGGLSLQPDGVKATSCWVNIHDFVEWQVKVVKAGDFTATLNYSCAWDSGGSYFELSADGKPMVTGKIGPTANWYDYKVVNLGNLHIDKPGMITMTVRPTNVPHGAVMNLASITLTPVAQ